MGKEQDDHPSEPTVSVPLSEYLELMSAKLDRPPVRTRAERRMDRITKLTEDAQLILPSLNDLEVREKKLTGKRCFGLARRILREIQRIEIQYEDSPNDSVPCDSIFLNCLNHYRHVYDPEARGELRRLGIRMIHVGDNVYHPQTGEAPVLTAYQYQLPLELRPLLPLFVAIYFIPKHHLPIPPDIECYLKKPA